MRLIYNQAFDSIINRLYPTVENVVINNGDVRPIHARIAFSSVQDLDRLSRKPLLRLAIPVHFKRRRNDNNRRKGLSGLQHRKRLNGIVRNDMRASDIEAVGSRDADTDSLL